MIIKMFANFSFGYKKHPRDQIISIHYYFIYSLFKVDKIYKTYNKNLFTLKLLNLSKSMLIHVNFLI